MEEIYGVCVEVAVPPFVLVWLIRLLARLVAVLVGSDRCVDCAPCVWLTPPVLPFCVGVCVCGPLVLVPELLAEVDGLALAEPLLVTAPPVAVVLPAV